MIIKHEKGNAIKGWELTIECTPEEYVELLNLKSDLHRKEIFKMRRIEKQKKSQNLKTNDK
jgi:hypothetical protein